MLAQLRAHVRDFPRASVQIAVDDRTWLLHGHSVGDRLVVTLRDRTEERAVEAELLAFQRMDSVGFLASTLVHDFNNLLTPIALLGANLESRLGPERIEHAMARDIRAAAERAAGIARQMMNLLRRQPARVEMVNVSAVLAELQGLLERVAGVGITLELSLDADLGDAMVDRERLEHVIVNLVANARDAMPEGGRLTLETQHVTLHDEDVRAIARAAPGSYAVIRATDTGLGMSAEVRARVLQGFHTTKRSGTGLGLGMTRRFLADSDGFLSVTSAPGRGTTVALHLPSVASPPRPAVVETSEPARGSETVLVVDDELLVLSATRTILEDHGYRVLQASSGEEALRVAAAYDGPIHVVLTDVVLPGASGPWWVNRLEHDPTPIVLFTSGHPQHVLERYGLAEDDRRVLRKTYTPAQLLRRVREALEGGGGASDAA
jgi:signal transduction histidine kinase/CheY-like chemotaxis protein